MKANQEIRTRIFINGLRNWQVAESIGISDSRLSVWLRTPLDNMRKIRVEEAIDKLIAQKMKEG